MKGVPIEFVTSSSTLLLTHSAQEIEPCRDTKKQTRLINNHYPPSSQFEVRGPQYVWA